MIVPQSERSEGERPVSGGAQPGPAIRYRWSAAAGTRPSRHRHVNEDGHLCLPDRGVFAVADGMGGHSAGDLASRRIVECLAGLNRVRSLPDSVEEAAQRLNTVNRDLMSEATRRGAGVIIGSTVVVMLALDEEIGFLWAGDSRLYLLRADELFLLTRDHTLLHHLQDRGELGPEADETHPGASALVRAVGSDFSLHLDRAALVVRPGDTFLLCTDGLTKCVDDAAIAESLMEPPEVALGDLLDRSFAAGATDDVTAIVVRPEPAE